MSKILVLGRTMDMGGTEVAMAALLQKLVEKKEDVTLLLVEKRGVLLERIPKEVEVRQMIWDKKPHSEPERRMRGKKRSGSTEKISGGCSGPGTLFRSMIKFTAFPSLSGNRSLPVFRNSRTGQRFC